MDSISSTTLGIDFGSHSDTNTKSKPKKQTKSFLPSSIHSSS
jgi:hypothetical protein